MKFLRSFIFTLAFYCNMPLWLIACLPLLLLPKKYTFVIARWWAASSLWLLKVCVGTKTEFRNLERIPKGAVLIAAKHQSFCETFAIFLVSESPAFVLKKELMWIPLFGWYLKKMGCIAVDRDDGEHAIRAMTAKAKKIMADNQQLVIFPEGTRRAPDAPPDYKRGVALLYRLLNKPCAPIALNSGLFWPRRQFIKNSGTIVLEVCDVIEPGLKRDEFLSVMQDTIETASHRLLEEGRKSL